MSITTLREQLMEWTDRDSAAFALACSLGLMDKNNWLKAKHIFWTDNPIGNLLRKMLGDLVALGVLENRSEPDDQYRWNDSFKFGVEREQV